MPLAAIRSLALLTLLAPLAACSGEGNDDGFSTSYDRRVAEAEALLDAAADEDFTLQEALPTGSAVYDGVIILADDEDDSYALAGDLGLTVDFSDLEVSGQITNVADSEGQTYGGTLGVGEDYDGVSLVDPSADPETEDVFTANFGGTLTAGLDSWDVDGALGGDLIGPNAEFAVGTATAEVCPDGTLDCTDFSGILIAD